MYHTEWCYVLFLSLEMEQNFAPSILLRRQFDVPRTHTSLLSDATRVDLVAQMGSLCDIKVEGLDTSAHSCEVLEASIGGSIK